MGMSTHVKGIRDLSHPNMQKHLKVVEACIDAGVPVPEDTKKFFGPTDEDPDNLAPGNFDSFLCEIESTDLGEAARDWKNEYEEGIEVEVAKLPPEVKVIRFYNSW